MKGRSLNVYTVTFAIAGTLLQMFSEGTLYKYVSLMNLLLLIFYFVKNKRYLIFLGYKVRFNNHMPILLLCITNFGFTTLMCL